MGLRYQWFLFRHYMFSATLRVSAVLRFPEGTNVEEILNGVDEVGWRGRKGDICIFEQKGSIRKREEIDEALIECLNKAKRDLIRVLNQYDGELQINHIYTGREKYWDYVEISKNLWKLILEYNGSIRCVINMKFSKDEDEPYCELRFSWTLYFDNDTDMNLITQKLGREPSIAENKKDRRMNPCKNYEDHLPGLWEKKLKPVRTLDFAGAANILVQDIQPYIDQLKEIKEEHDAEIYLNFVIINSWDCTPEIVLTSDVLKLADELDAEISIDI